MRCSTTEVEIEVLLRRIDIKDINLQPDFQRGEVWSTQKKRKLIDSIFRGWRIPPIHVLENINYVDEVLDGQQRLATIRDFYENRISIDGKILPEDDVIISLDGLYYYELDPDLQRMFRKYSLTIIRLTEYKPDEPAELFNRLNQPSTLTSAEKRNAYIGLTRDQIRNLVLYFENKGANKDTIGFSNSRMAYDEVLSKYCYTLSENSLRKKITSSDLTEQYRLDIGFSDDILNKTKEALDILLEAKLKLSKLNLNKATLFSWLVFIARNKGNLDNDLLSNLIFGFENARQYSKGKYQISLLNYNSMYDNEPKFPFYQSMFLLFNQKASMSSTDASSIIIRDIILELYRLIKTKNYDYHLTWFNNLYVETNNLTLCIESFEKEFEWGSKII